MICKNCGQEIDNKAAVCVHCGVKTQNFDKAMGNRPFYKKWWFWVIVVLVGLYIIGVSSGKEDSGDPTPTTDNSAVEPSGSVDPSTSPSDAATLPADTNPPTTESPTTEPPTTIPPTTTPPTTSPAETQKPTEAGPTTGEKNALRAANNYLRIMPFSYEGLIGQLEFEGYTKAEATYAANNCGADWKEQALRDAKNYLDITPFSYSGLIEQLEFEEYTTEQATYGADNCGADWFEQAVRSAKNYLDIMPFSRAGLIEQLEFEGFTHEQAVHGVEANGL